MASFILQLAGYYHAFTDFGDRGEFCRDLAQQGRLQVFLSREPDNEHDRFAIKVTPRAMINRNASRLYLENYIL